LNPDFNSNKILGPLKHVINIILQIRYMGVLHRVPPGFPSLAAAGGQTTFSGYPIVPGTEDGGQTAHPLATPSSSALPTSTMPHTMPTPSATPHATPTIPPAPPAAPVSQHYSRYPRAAREPPALPLLQHSPPVKAVPVAPSVNPHLMIT
jgi:hypothetical protein